MNTDTIKAILKYYGLSIVSLISLRFFSPFLFSSFSGWAFAIGLSVIALFSLIFTVPLIKRGIGLKGLGGLLLELFYIGYITLFIYGFFAIWDDVLYALIYILFSLSIIFYPLILRVSIIQNYMAQSQSRANIVKYSFIGLLAVYSVLLYTLGIETIGYYEGFQLWMCAIFIGILLLKNVIPDKYSLGTNADSSISKEKNRISLPITRGYIISFIIVGLVNIYIGILFGLIFDPGCRREAWGCWSYYYHAIILAIPSVPTFAIFIAKNISIVSDYKEKVYKNALFILYVPLLVFFGCIFTFIGLRNIIFQAEFIDIVFKYGYLVISGILGLVIFMKISIDLYYLIKIRNILKLESAHAEVQTPEVIVSNQDSAVVQEGGAFLGIDNNIE